MLTRLRFLVLFFVLSAAFSLARGASAQSGSVTGIVTSAETNAPLPGVNVTLDVDEKRGTITNAEGAYRLHNVASGTYKVRFSAIGYASVQREVEVESDDATVLDVALSPRRYGVGEVIVSASRRAEQVKDVPSAVTVLGPEDLEQQAAISPDLGSMLAQKVPGLAPSTGTLSNYGQTLRGRDMAVLIDGIPQSTPLRQAYRSLRTIDPAALERVEVVRGASAVYGYGATGGVVNFITKRPAQDGLRLRAEAGSRFSGDEVGNSLGGDVKLMGSGRSGPVDAVIGGAYERWGYFYDGEGDLIPQDPQGQGGLAGANEYNALAKVGVQLGEEQRLNALVNYYDFKQQMEYATVPGVVDSAKATAREDGDPAGEDPGTDNLIAGLSYTHDAVLGSQLSARVYHQNYMTRFGVSPGFGQSYVTSEKWGARLDVETPLPPSGSTLRWGLDALSDETAQPLVSGQTFAPPVRQMSVAPFAQVKLPLGERVLLRGGARYENFSLDIDDFTTIDGNDVEGGQLGYDAFVFNTGGTVFLMEGLEAYASFAQGFSVNEIGRVLRYTTASSVEAIRPEAQTVNSYEVGARFGVAPVEASLTGFVNTSELGSAFALDTTDAGNLQLNIQRNPERVWGLEATIDADVTDQIGLGGTASLMEGKRDTDDDGSFEQYLPGYRIPPLKVTGHASYAPTSGWKNRVQVLYSGARDLFPEGGYGEGSVEPYARIDLYSAISLAPHAPGRLKLGIQNLLDSFYFPTVSQWRNLNGAGYAAAPGRRLSLSYAVSF